MRILIFNWRDVMHPSSGGAEILTHELAKRWVQEGNEVVQFCSWYEGAKKSEVIDGVKIIREGKADARYLWGSVHFRAFINYQRNFKGKFDVVIDEIHGLPFFISLYVKEKKIALICEVADELWYKMYGVLFGTIGRLTEIVYLKLLYRSMHFLTISESTKKDLMKNGVSQKKIDVIPMGVRLLAIKKLPLKEKNPTLLFVGRLSKPKGIEDAIQIIEKVRKFIPNTKLWIVGRGEESYTEFLKTIIKQRKLDKSVILFGYVSEIKKFELMSRAHILVVPSIKEGFGLTLPEAGSVGTPAIAYNVKGIRDIIKDNINGILVDPDTDKLSRKVIRVLQNKNEYNALKKNLKYFYSQFNFDKTARETLKLIKKYS